MKGVLCNQLVTKNILDGTQSQDRRPMNPQPIIKENGEWRWHYKAKGITRHGPNLDYMLKELPKCGPSKVGDILYVREAWWPLSRNRRTQVRVAYLADMVEIVHDIPEDKTAQADKFIIKHRKAASIHMPKWAARVFLEVTAVRCERVQETSIADIKAEGVTFDLIRDMLKPTKTKQGHWISGNDYNQSDDYCYDCAVEIVKEQNKKFNNTDCLVDGGWENHDSDYIARCEKCDCLLNFWPTEHLIETEIDGFEQSDCSLGMSNEDRYMFDVMCNAIDSYPEPLSDRLLTLCWQYLWNTLYTGSWERNDWVWVRTFKKIKKPQ